MTNEEIARLEERRKKEYFAIKKVYCPVLDCDVSFNKKGWVHLRYEHNIHARNRKDLMRRFHLFPWAKKIITSPVCGIRSETESDGYTKIFLSKGKIEVMLRRKVGSKVLYYYSISDHRIPNKKRKPASGLSSKI